MKQFQIELDETVCMWLEHIARTTNQPVEKVISNCIHNHIVNLEEAAIKTFTYRE